MKIEFKKVPTTPKEFINEFSSVKIEGTFCKMSPSLVKIEAKLVGEIPIVCSRCGEEHTISLNDELNFLLSDGIYKSNSDSDELVIEVEESLIDFDEILESEISSIQSDYYICQKCEDGDFVEKEY
ncbi:hypothetical protein [Halarcobacter ebronensis]|uniref:Uncharacterized protein n=1 Tax=Halarcobacter ebronensis TaxID=1462615 RepID=A0A4V1LZW2_9BACT|nr:hypothetical protein [Halarcobacter ebronensis]QKF83094.1 hypothetical protein AEBR_2638 [Halarcobacter ebronensis]RXK02391.1 hypothetical protein CRV07_13685 [Halarcobacter ebronensis]